MWENYSVLQSSASTWLVRLQSFVFEKGLHQQTYKGLRKSLDAGFSKHHISNLFISQGELHTAYISPLTAIEKFSGVHNGKIQADFYDDCRGIPDPSSLDPTQNNLLLMDDCFLGKENKGAAYYTRGRHNNNAIRYTLHKTISGYLHTIRENSTFIILYQQDVKNLTHIYADHCASHLPLAEFKQF